MKIPDIYKLISLSILGIASSAVAQDFILNQNANLVLGQALFTTNSSALVKSTSLNFPLGVAVDPTTGKTFIADTLNNRVMRYTNSSSLVNGATADGVIGQINYTSNTTGISQQTLNHPLGLYVDSGGTLYVADGNNRRVLTYNNAAYLPAANASADRVIGQPDFATNTQGNSSQKLSVPWGVCVSSADTLFVTDYLDNRLLGYKNISQSAANFPVADLVVGQTAFGMGTSGTSATKLNVPRGCMVDSEDHLWVADGLNRRVLRFDNASTLPQFDAAADGVLGQPDFTTNTSNLTATGMNVAFDVAMDNSESLYVADYVHNRVLIYKNPAAKINGGAADLVLGQPDFTTDTNHLTQNSVPSAAGLAFDMSGQLFVTNADGNRVMRFTKPMPVPHVAPTVKITGKKKIITTLTQRKIKGTAFASDGSVQLVQVKLGKKAYKSAKGTTSWLYKAKTLKLGKNVFMVRALGSNGLYSVPAKLTIMRK